MPGDRKDALAEIEEALDFARGRHGIKILGHACEYCDVLDRALSILPRLREVVEAAGEIRQDMADASMPSRRTLEVLLKRLAALEGGKDGA